MVNLYVCASSQQSKTGGQDEGFMDEIIMRVESRD